MTKQAENYSPTVNQPASSMATISLIAGVLGLTLFPFIGSIVAVATGVMARREIREAEGALGGDGLATAGLVLGWIGVALTVMGLCLLAVVFGLPLLIGLFAVVSDNAGLLVPWALAVV
jgi:hypothetical protein